MQHTVNHTFHNNFFSDSCSGQNDWVTYLLMPEDSWLQVHHSNGHPATLGYSPKHFFDVPDMLELNGLCCGVNLASLWLWWLNWQNVNHTYLKLTKLCGGNF